MLMQFLLFYLFEFSIAQQIGGTSMDSTHYDRRLFQQKQCYAPNQPKELYQSNYWITVRSVPSFDMNNSFINNSLAFQRQLIFRNQHDRLVTRVSSGAIDLNNTRPLGIDQASINITVDQQVSMMII